jgi:hypothetical protein
MISTNDLAKYSKEWKIDNYAIMREYMQLVILGALYQINNSEQIYFKGGTALRLIYKSIRFSEDLDFNSKLPREEIIKILKKSIDHIKDIFPGIYLDTIKNKYDNIHTRAMYKSIDLPQPLNIAIDVNTKDGALTEYTSLLSSPFPLPYYSFIKTLGLDEILAEKISALMNRSKGRDVFDIWFLLNRQVKIDMELLEKKMELYNKQITIEDIINKIKQYDEKKLKNELNKYLPENQRNIIPFLKDSLTKILLPLK